MFEDYRNYTSLGPASLKIPSFDSRRLGGPIQCAHGRLRRSETFSEGIEAKTAANVETLVEVPTLQ